MIRLSFRHGLLAGFFVIVLLLGGSAFKSWLMLEHLVEQSRLGNLQSIDLSALIQELDERTVDIERSARQYLVLDDPAIRQQFEENLAIALDRLTQLEALAGSALADDLKVWREQAAGLRKGLHDGVSQSRIDGKLAALGERNVSIAQVGKALIAGQNTRLIEALERSRLQLGAEIVLALLGALLVAMAIAWWLVRPLRQLEAAIVRLGRSRFDRVVAVGGPDDLQHLGQRLDWLRQRLAELEADRARTLRHVSHELKTPLTALREGIALLADEIVGPLEPRQREVVDILRHNVAAQQRQIESLLRLNSASFDARRLNPQRLELRSLIEAAVAERQLHAKAREVRIAVDAQGSAKLDGEKLTVILDNLLSNAIDFSPAGGEVRLSLMRAGGRLYIDCADDGPGIAAEDRLRIFEPFEQGRIKAPAQRQGSGVGLSIVRELATAMGGGVSLLDSARGARFRVDLPDEK